MGQKLFLTRDLKYGAWFWKIKGIRITFNVLALSTKNCNVFSLRHRYSNISCFFYIYEQKLFTKNPYCWYYFSLVIIGVILENVFHRIARFVIYNYVTGGGSRFWLVIFNYFSLYRLKTMSINKNKNDFKCRAKSKTRKPRKLVFFFIKPHRKV